MTVFDTALVTLHADVNMAIAAHYRRPPQTWTAIRVIRFRPEDSSGGLGIVGVRAGQHQVDVVAAALPYIPAPGDEIKIGAVIHTVESSEADVLALSYRLTLSEPAEA